MNTTDNKQSGSESCNAMGGATAFKPSFPNPDVWTDELIRARQAEYAAFLKTPEGIAEEARVSALLDPAAGK